MPSGIIKRQGNRFDATYEQPWGGVASNADPVDIQPSHFVQADGILVKNGRLLVSQFAQTIAYNYSTTNPQGYWPQSDITFLCYYFKEPINWYLAAFDQHNGAAYTYDTLNKKFILDQQLAGGGAFQFDCYQLIQGVFYIFDYLNGCEYVYTPGVSFVVGQTFVGGKYCFVLSNYLITAYTFQQSDSPKHRSNRYNWSAPFAYTTYDPAIDRTSGFNTIASVSDQITGGFSMGNVGYILRTEGLSQLTPTGIGITPFDLQDLWDSQFGIGCTYPDTFDQFGVLAIWGNNNNFYAFFSGAMPQGLTGAAQAAIFGDIDKYQFSADRSTIVSGSISNMSETTIIPELMYTIAVTHIQGSTGIIESVFWLYNIDAKTWTRVVSPNINTYITQQLGSSTWQVTRATLQGVTKISGVNTVATTLAPRGVINYFLVTVFQNPGTYNSFLFVLYYNENGIPSLCPVPMTLALATRPEEIRLGTKPTVRGVIIKAHGITGVPATINVTVSGTSFSPITVTGSAAKTYRSSGVYTGENPQLVLSSTNLDATIVKANMLMTYEEGEPL